ncbi:MAG: hypothetical protein Q9216_002719 [Gyalolechia sp. 2 TL-2023]
MIQQFAYIYILSFYIFAHVCQSKSTSFVPRQASSKSTPSASTLVGSASRHVFIQTEVYLWKQAVSQRTGKPVYAGHGRLWVNGTENEGPLFVELALNPTSPQPGPSLNRKYAVVSKDLGVANTGKTWWMPSTSTSTQVNNYVITQGETVLTNPEIFDHEAGTGLLADAWLEDPVYRMGTGSTPNTCYQLVERVLGRMNLDMDPLTKELFGNSTEYYTSYSRISVQRVQDVFSTTWRIEDDLTKIEQRGFNVDIEQDPNAPEVIYEKTRWIPIPNAILGLANEMDEGTSPRGASIS